MICVRDYKARSHQTKKYDDSLDMSFILVFFFFFIQSLEEEKNDNRDQSFYV
jgi:hypothetical protein